MELFLLGIVVAAIGWFGGVATSSFLQDRQYYREQRGLIAILAAELKRLEGELGPSKEHWTDFSAYGTEVVSPTIHPWIRDRIPDVAHIDSDVLALFLGLDTLLENQRAFITANRHLREESKSAHEEYLERQRAIGPAVAGTASDAGNAVSVWVAVKNRDDSLRTAAAEARDRVDRNYRSIRAAIDSISGKLRAADSRLQTLPSFNFARFYRTRVHLVSEDLAAKERKKISAMSNRQHR